MISIVQLQRLDTWMLHSFVLKNERPTDRQCRTLSWCWTMNSPSYRLRCNRLSRMSEISKIRVRASRKPLKINLQSQLLLLDETCVFCLFYLFTWKLEDQKIERLIDFAIEDLPFCHINYMAENYKNVYRMQKHCTSFSYGRKFCNRIRICYI